ncbi:DNA polymerase delta, subunit 4-domain-containing protein [Mycena pura]|uniref:DNA polymerase delta, subunit 4-domain-containing protein n=1 Tax=Mycena pura TaxID=153505 RepID=A0AAD7E511_9AGAR|nr:DNA polymerase delta, subunit 4-domain-containing protein [Mycena pura]
MPKTSAKSKSTSAASLKQVTLSFSAAKRTASGKKPGQQLTPRASQTRVAAHSNKDEIEVDDIDVSSSSDGDEIEVIESDAQVEVSNKPARDTTTSKGELKPKDPKWRKTLNAARARQGKGTVLVHAEGQDQFHEILRVFDLSYEFGPCVGVTRLERWMRAQALGLSPPNEVRDMLDSRQGAEAYSQCVLHRSRSNRAYITTMGMDVSTFDAILGAGFADAWMYTRIPRRDSSGTGRTCPGGRSLDAAGALGLVLHYLGSTMPGTSLSVSQILIEVLRRMPEGAIRWPTGDEFEEYSELITARHARLTGAFASIDGLNLPVQESADSELENATYNGCQVI